MLKTFIARISTVLTVLLGLVFFTINFELSNMMCVLILVACFAIFGLISYSCLKEKSETEIKEILGLSWLENKTGINFTEE